MTRITKFVDAFWGTDFCSTAGFDVLHKRVKEGRQVCKDLEEFLKQRAKIEEDYGKALLKLSHTTGGKVEIGTSRSSWENLKQQMERVSQVHINLGMTIMEQVTRVNSLVEKHKEKRKLIEETLKKYQSAKKSLYRKTQDLKKMYESKCGDADLAEKLVKSSSTLPQKELDKLSAKQQKTRQEADKQDAAYKTSVTNLEAARVQWERSMTQACELQYYMKTFTTHHAQVATPVLRLAPSLPSLMPFRMLAQNSLRVTGERIPMASLQKFLMKDCIHKLVTFPLNKLLSEVPCVLVAKCRDGASFVISSILALYLFLIVYVVKFTQHLYAL
ncbi:proline-serine-threonine phosphatase-interacting protein 1-like isoform X2 [Lineus longissimus]|uniref:proline-serine-threonine phosphatase-interacting protein 1-like isoform X2 n=1 Tax=Lineus longissimus TaxID=88925 RepID=UPI002B4D9EE3